MFIAAIADCMLAPLCVQVSEKFGKALCAVPGAALQISSVVIQTAQE
jgi:hypothetical protein